MEIFVEEIVVTCTEEGCPGRYCSDPLLTHKVSDSLQSCFFKVFQNKVVSDLTKFTYQVDQGTFFFTFTFDTEQETWQAARNNTKVTHS